MPETQRDFLAETLIERDDVLRSDRQPYETIWQSVTRYTIPREAYFTEEVTAGVDRNRYVLDSTAPRSHELFASFLHTLLSNPSLQWFKYRTDDDRLNKNTENKQWLEEAAKRDLARMNGPGVNIDPTLHKVYLDLGSIGIGNLFSDVVAGQPRAQTYHFGDITIEENEAGFVDVVHRHRRITPRQADQRWPGIPRGKAVEERLAKGGKALSEKVLFQHSVVPMDDPQISKFLPERIKATGAPFVSIWLNREDRLTVAMSTYQELPYHIPRWYKTDADAPYARSPAMTALPDIRMANRMRETILRGAEKLVDPPLLIPDGGIVSPVRLHPGGISFSEGNVKPEALIPPGASRIEFGDALLQRTQRDIERAFFVPLFVTDDSPVKTATQILQEADERNRAITPMLMRVQSELFHTFVKRWFKMMDRLGLHDPRPEGLIGRDIEIEYVSPLTGSQRQVEALATARLFEGLAPWAGVDQGIFDNFDPDKVASIMHGGTGAPAVLLRSTEQVKAVRKARNDQAQQAEQLQMLQEGAGAAAQLISADAKQKSSRS